jgi:acetylornithine aminotransferase/acetylornithine/N-succinyldiaminopimelate aminotransferase
MHGTTFGGGPLACSVALELIKVVEKQKLLKHVQKTGDYMVAKLNALKKKHPAITEIRGLGLMIGVELESADLAKAAFQSMLEQRVILNRTDETVLRFLPPFIVKKKHVDEVIQKLDKALSSQARKEAAAVTTASRRTR